MAYRRTEKIEERLAETRLNIVWAARRLVSRGGFRAAPIAQVASEAGVATGTVYRYFPSKTDLMREVVDLVSAREVEVLEEIAASSGPAADRLADAVRAFADRAMRARVLAYALLAEPVDPEIEAARLVWRRSHGRAIERIVRDGVAEGAFALQDPGAAAACLVGAFMEALIGPLSPEAGDLAGREEQLISEIVAFCLRGAIGPDAAASQAAE